MVALRRIFGLAAGVAALSLLASCGGGGGSGTATGPVLSGGAVKGPLSGATVCAYAISGGAKGAQLPLASAGGSGSISGSCYVTGADGGYSFSLPAGTTGEVLVESSGGRFCSNETPIVNGACPGGGTVLALAANDTLSGVVGVPAPGATSTLYLTPLTTAAVGAAGGSLSAASFTAQFTTLAGNLGVAGSVTPATPPNTTNQAYLAQLAQQIQSGGSLTNAVNTLRQGGTNPGDTTPATVNAALAGSYNLKFYKGGGDGCGQVCSFSEAQDVPVAIHADGRLSLPGKVLTNPFYRSYGGSPHLPEVIWLDAAANVEYALTDNEGGTFSEINVGDASQRQAPFGIPRFLGQIRMPVQSGTAALAPFVGTHAVASQYYGATVAWTSLTVAADGALTFEGATALNVAAAQIASITDYLGCCGSVAITLNIDYNNDGEVNGDDRIDLYRGSGGALRDIEYRRSANFSERIGVTVAAQSDLPAHAGSLPVPDSNRVTALVSDVEVGVASTENTISSSLTGFSLVAAEVNGSSVLQKQWTLQVASTSALQQGSTYVCRRGSGAETTITFQPSTNVIYRSDYGGRCSVTITHLASANGAITEVSGTFTAELGTFKHDTVLVRDGVFRWVKPVP